MLTIENRAAALFRDHGYPQVSDDPLPDVASVERLVAGARAWVVTSQDGGPAGFAVAAPVAGWLHLKELSVDPRHGRRGIGAALVGAVLTAAADLGLAGVSLTTFRTVPFNGPFYAKLGFSEAAGGEPAELAALILAELPAGVDAGERILMLRRN